MGTAQAIAYVALATVFVLFSCLGFITLGTARLQSFLGIFRDGLAPGSRAPGWKLRAIDGRMFSTPSGGPWQVLMFVNHAIVEFPTVVPTLRNLLGDVSNLEVLILSQTDPMLTHSACLPLGLDVPVIYAGPAIYGKYNVRVMPLAFVVDGHGFVLAVGLANSGEAVDAIWRAARAAGHSRAAPPAAVPEPG
jgi:hypothetical protein